MDSSAVERIKPDQATEDKIFSDPSLQYDIRSGEQQNLLNKFLEWLAEQLFGRAGHENIQSARDIVIWTIVILSVLVVIRLLYRSQLTGLIKPKTKKVSFNFMDISGDLSEVNFTSHIDEAIRSGDLRLATRWLFLKTLFLLDKKGRINFAPYKTNYDYYEELKEKKEHDAFRSLCRIYEFAWYGQHDVNLGRFEQEREKFSQFERTLNAEG